MKLIYLIAIHKNIEQTNDLIDSIYHDDNVSIYVHIDKNSKIEPASINSKAKIIKNRISVIWGDYSQVQATLTSIEEIDNIEQDYSHICFISGQDYPIKSNKDIRESIEENKDYLEYLEIYKQNDWKVHHRFEGWYYTKKFHILRRISWYATRFHQKYLNIRRKPLPGIIPFGGSSWWILSKASIQFILNFVKEPVNKKFVNYFKLMCCCDEHFFHCILLNSERKSNIVNDNLRYIVWRHGANPKILTIDDYNTIIDSNKLFCRKIDFPASQELVENLKENRNKNTF